MHHRHRQERWLHTRISADLDEALRREARKQRTPVSLLVRNVLEGALDLVEEIVEDGIEIADTSRRFAQRVSRAARGEGDRSDGPERRERHERPRRHDSHEDRTDSLDRVYGW